MNSSPIICECGRGAPIWMVDGKIECAYCMKARVEIENEWLKKALDAIITVTPPYAARNDIDFWKVKATMCQEIATKARMKQ